MCGITGAINLCGREIERLIPTLSVMEMLQAHRGPDGSGIWVSDQKNVGLGHQRLAVMDLSQKASQPMLDHKGQVALVFNGEIYNHKQIREELRSQWNFNSHSDTETILACYRKYGIECVSKLRGMFAYSLWDEAKNQLICARDRFGIKPFYYTIVDKILYFASEAKALLPVMEEIGTDEEAMAEYLSFQYTIGEKTLFKGINQLLPGHQLIISNGIISIERYWDVRFEIDYEHSEKYFLNQLTGILESSVEEHLLSDVPIGAYISGGIDSSLIALMAHRKNNTCHKFFHGRFTESKGYDESEYAKCVSKEVDGELHIADINSSDFERYFSDVIYHLDFPTAGPGSFPQYMVSKLASQYVKVILGGQGGDEIFGGYARYLVAYFEQCIKSCIEGTHQNGNFVVTIESIIPNLGLLREYKPMMSKLWKDGLFGPMDQRYYKLISRCDDMGEEIKWEELNFSKVYESFTAIFNNNNNVKKECYFDSMTHFDFKTLLPALLHVEDRMSMAHGLESRVPMLDHRLIEFAATVPADIKFKGGQLKRLLKVAFSDLIPEKVVNRRDKMGFPVPLQAWFNNDLNNMCIKLFENMRDSKRPFVNGEFILNSFHEAPDFSRRSWGLASLEVWYSLFHDRSRYFKDLIDSVHPPQSLVVGFKK